jgi:YHS domain-containing protein
VQFTNQQGIVSVIQLDVILDPFCEMNVKETHCHDTTTYKSLRYGFCSSVCKEAFLKDPNMYIK